MLRLEFYAQQMARHDAARIELISNEAAVFHFATGARKSNKEIDHEQLVSIIEESASRETWLEIEGGGRSSFIYKTPSGFSVRVGVECLSAEKWRVIVSSDEDRTAEVDVRAQSERPMPGDRTQQIPYGSVAHYESADQHEVKGPLPAALIERTALQPELASPLDTHVNDNPVAESLTERMDVGQRVNPDVESGFREVQQEPPSVSIPSSGGFSSVNDLLEEMVRQGASDLHLSSGCRPMFRLQGNMVVVEQARLLENEELGTMLELIMPERNRREFAKDRDTDFGHVIEGVARFRCNVFVDRRGVCAVFRQIPIEIMTPQQLGIPAQVLDFCWLSKGLVLITGPTGSGKSTTLASLIDVINEKRSDHIITIEDPIEFVHENKQCLVNQREINSHTSSFKNALRAALREDPDIVLVGEMRDLETISIAIETAETGHLVFGTLHTTTAASTVDRVIDQFPPEQQAQIRVMLSESLRGVVAQNLCRTVAGKRVAAYEVLNVTPAISNLIREGKTFQIQSAMQVGKKHGMQLMNDQLLELVKQQLVSPEEAYLKAGDKQQLLTQFQQNHIPFAASSFQSRSGVVG